MTPSKPRAVIFIIAAVIFFVFGSIFAYAGDAPVRYPWPMGTSHPPLSDKEKALVQAIKHEQVPIVQALIDEKVNVNAIYENNMTPLLYAVMGRVDSTEKHLMIAKVLIEHGANVNASNIYDRTSLSLAAQDCNSDMARLLIERGADINANHGDAIVNAAGNCPVIAKLLVEKGADINASGDVGSALFYSAQEGDTKITRLLLDHGAKINYQNAWGSTPLMEAVKQGHVEDVRMLIEHGADVDTVDKSGNTALSYAEQSKQEDLVVILKGLAFRNVQPSQRKQ